MVAPRIATYVAAVMYGVALGMCTVLLPLLALSAGHSASDIGWFAGCGALVQLVSRGLVGPLLRRFPDRTLIAVAIVAMLGAFAAVWVSGDEVAFATAMSLEGLSRAWFWTGVQTHVVHGQDRVGASLAKVTLAGNVGLVLGPALAGACLLVSSDLALGSGIAFNILALGLACGLRRWPPFRPLAGAGRVRVWRRGPVVLGGVATSVAGCWRGLLGSYVPVALVAGSLTSAGVGAAIALGNAASALAALVLVRWQSGRPSLLIAVSCVAAGAGIGLLGTVAGSVLAVCVCLLVSGLGAGLLQILGTSVATQGVDPEERGDVLALTGMIRSTSIMLAPVTVAALLIVTPLAGALALLGAAMTLPVPSLLLRRDR